MSIIYRQYVYGNIYGIISWTSVFCEQDLVEELLQRENVIFTVPIAFLCCLLVSCDIRTHHLLLLLTVPRVRKVEELLSPFPQVIRESLLCQQQEQTHVF